MIVPRSDGLPREVEGFMELDGLVCGGDSALVVVDMQNAFCHLDGGFAKAGRDVSAANSIIPTVASLVRAAHDARLPVLWTIQEGLGPDDRGRQHRRIPSILRKEELGGSQAWCIRNTWDAELVDELQRERKDEDYVVRKHRMSAFYSTTLESLLRIMRIQVLVIAGVNTEKCVESTVRDAFFRDYDVLVVSDGVATADRSLHDDTLKKVDLYFGAVVSSDDVLHQLRQLAGDTAPRAVAIEAVGP
jgi:ureidoacrylate peracid hydrolase